MNGAAHESSVEELKNISELLQTVYILDENSNVRTAIDVVFDYFNKQIRNRRYEICNYVLANVDVKRLSSTLMVAFLSITLPVKRELWVRNMFFKVVHQTILNDRGKERTERLLNKYL
jgi:hypothetical protein